VNNFSAFSLPLLPRTSFDVQISNSLCYEPSIYVSPLITRSALPCRRERWQANSSAVHFFFALPMSSKTASAKAADEKVDPKHAKGLDDGTISTHCVL
jgi:hypothetical protein